MKRFAPIFAAVLTATALVAAPAQGAFGLSDFDVTITNKDGSLATRAGSHPFAVTSSFSLNFTGEGPTAILEGKVRDALIEATAGLVGDATTLPRCSMAEFLEDTEIRHTCPVEAVVGMQAAAVANPDLKLFEAEKPGPIFNLPPPPGVPLRLGWNVRKVPVVIDLGIEQAPGYEEVKEGPDYNGIVSARGINQTLAVFRSVVEVWGVPADPVHDAVRGWDCRDNAKVVEGKRIERVSSVCAEGSSTAPVLPFLTLPRSCPPAAISTYEVRSWQEPGVWVTGSHVGPGFDGCDKLAAIFSPDISSQATTDSAGTSTGLDFSIEFDDSGLKNPDPEAVAQSDIEKAVITLPDGVTLNPSAAEGLGVCTPADLDKETLSSAPGQGCPNASKVGTVRVESPLVDEAVDGSVFVAQQDDPSTTGQGEENPFDSLIAFYIVLKSSKLGILIKQPAKVEPDPKTGQLVTTVEDVPQIPFSRFEFHFREGQRAPLISPSACGTYTTKAAFTPRADPSQVRTELATFQITRGVGGGPCPSGGVPPFSPGFQAGALNNDAGTYSPFHMRLTRADGEQDMTKFSAVLPPGMTGKLAGVGRCSDAQIAAAKAKSGRQEQALPSCSSASRIGTTLGGAGVGSALTYVPGSLYLSGPYKGAPLSVVAITPAVAGPFDAGTVVVRVGLDLNPITGQVEVDGAASDPIPHILKGIPLKLRDLEVKVDRPNFTLNATNCDPSATRATLFGSFLNLLSPADDVPITLSSRHQIANCANLPFKPRLAFRLKGGTSRGAHPAFQAVLRPRPGNANIEGAVVRLPRSAFLEQAHIRTICTRVQFAADACPKGAIYGRVTAFTPLLDEPLQGPVYLRSSNNKLPDIVFDLKGIVDIEASARVDSIRGGIRVTFDNVPDAPTSKVLVRMQGAKKGLIVNSRNLCAGANRANVRLDGHNGASRVLRPALLPAGCK